MKNILFEKPDDKNLTGRMIFSVNYVSDVDIKDKTVLNIGCGYGWCELNFLNRGVRKMYGIEITKDDLQTAKKSIDNEKIELKIGSAIDIPFPDEYFDTIVSWEVIEHIPKGMELKMFSEINRVLKSGGNFYLSTPNQSFFSNVLDPAWWLIGHRHYTKDNIEYYGKKKGLNLKDATVKGGLFSIFGVLNMYIAKWLFKRKPFFYEFFLRKERMEYEREDGFFNLFAKFYKD